MKVKKLHKHKVKSGESSYQNALTRADLDVPPEFYSCAVVESLGKSVYFKPIPSDIVIRLRDPQLAQMDQLVLLIDLLATSVVDPTDGSPFLSPEGWRRYPFEIITEISGAILGLQVTIEPSDTEIGSENLENTSEEEADPNSPANPTQSDETAG